MKDKMQIAINALKVIIAPIGVIVITILLHYDIQTLVVWVTFVSILSIILGFWLDLQRSFQEENGSIKTLWGTFIVIVIIMLASCSSWQYQIWENNRNEKTEETESLTQPKTSKLEEPTFSEETNDVSISFGNAGTFSTPISSLKEKPFVPINFNGFKPVKLYYLENNLYADVKIYGGSGLPAIQIKKNKLINKPQKWDFNSNKKALEIVNEKQIPMYQYIYKTSSHIILNGIFPLPGGGVIFASEGGSITNPSPSKMFSLKPIFKYPSWKYPGQYN
jgi:hypothetical protein